MLLLDNSFIILKYNGFSDRAPCTKLHKDEQKDRTKTLAEFPDHILNDYDLIHTNLTLIIRVISTFYTKIKKLKIDIQIW